MIVAALLLTAAPPAGDLPQAPASPPAWEDFTNPASRTVHSLYACMNGPGSITAQYDQFPNGAFASLARNGVLAAPGTLAELNRLVAPFDILSSVQPQCGTKEDALLISGMVGKRPAMMMIYWSTFRRGSP
jgi:hypothetical protein